MSNLDTFAKVRALHDRAATPGEKAAAMSRMQALARKAGMTVEEAVFKLDKPAPKPKTQAQTTADAFNDFFNSPEMRAARAEQDRARQQRRAEILKRYGSRKAVYAETEREAALRVACKPMTVRARRDQSGDYTLDGWDFFGAREKVPPRVRAAVAAGWPLPRTVKEAWAEYIAAEEHENDRQTMHDYEHFPTPWSEVRRYVVEDLLDTLPAASVADMLIRQTWMEHLNDRGFSRDIVEDAVVLKTLRADIERMGQRLREQDAATVQNGQREGEVSSTHPSPPPVQSGHPQGAAYCADPSRGAEAEGVVETTPSQPVQNGHRQGHPLGGYPSSLAAPEDGLKSQPIPPVQSGHRHRTNADKRRDVLALLDAVRTGNQSPLTDREIARRTGVSPTTVGTIRSTLTKEKT